MHDEGFFRQLLELALGPAASGLVVDHDLDLRASGGILCFLLCLNWLYNNYYTKVQETAGVTDVPKVAHKVAPMMIRKKRAVGERSRSQSPGSRKGRKWNTLVKAALAKLKNTDGTSARTIEKKVKSMYKGKLPSNFGKLVQNAVRTLKQTGKVQKNALQNYKLKKDEDEDDKQTIPSRRRPRGYHNHMMIYKRHSRRRCKGHWKKSCRKNLKRYRRRKSRRRRRTRRRMRRSRRKPKRKRRRRHLRRHKKHRSRRKHHRRGHRSRRKHHRRRHHRSRRHHHETEKEQHRRRHHRRKHHSLRSHHRRKHQSLRRHHRRRHHHHHHYGRRRPLLPTQRNPSEMDVPQIQNKTSPSMTG